MAEVGSKDPLARRVYATSVLCVGAYKLPRSDTPARVIVSEYVDVAHTFVETTPRPAWSTPCSINSRRAAGGVCLIPTSRYSCAFHLAANVSHSAMYFWFGIGPSVMALST